jgi:hypothetical protein
MGNLSSLAKATTAATALSNLILVSPQATIGYQPQNPPPDPSQPQTQQPPAFLFHFEGEQMVKLESDITDHYVEDNTARQDQIALRPEEITTHGFIGELNDVAPAGLATIQSTVDRLTTIGAYVPGLSATAQLVYAEAFAAYQLANNAINAGVSAWSSLSGTGGESVINGQGIQLQKNQNKQQTAFQLFYGYWRERRLFTVQTPWAVFQDMAIKSCVPVQDAETNVITEFQLTFKIIRTASTTLTSEPISVQGRLGTQSAGVTDLGSSTPATSTSLSTGLTSYSGALA